MISDFSRHAVRLCASLAILTGCGGSPAPIGAPIMMPRSAIAAHADRGGSWMIAKASKGDLLYISGDKASGGAVFVFTYPKGALVGEIATTAIGLCSDKKGNVFVATLDDYVLEYAHGGTTPIATLNDPGYYSEGCAVDPTTGNLAVTNYEGDPSGATGNVAVYRKAKGTPQLYSDPDFYTYWLCGYDSTGNLFVDGGLGSAWLAELPKGSSTFTNFTVNPGIESPTGVQWDGKYLAIGDDDRGLGGIYRVSVSGSTVSIVDHVSMLGPRSHRPDTVGQFWIQGHTVIGPSVLTVGFWPYPSGGHPTKYLHGFGATELNGSAISSAP
jgi:hypothetical protein